MKLANDDNYKNKYELINTVDTSGSWLVVDSANMAMVWSKCERLEKCY